MFYLGFVLTLRIPKISSEKRDEVAQMEQLDL